MPPADIVLPRLAIINGRWDEGPTEAFDNVGPRNGQVLNRVAACGEGDIDRAVSAARNAFEGGRWKDLAPRERKARMLKLSELMEDHAEELALLETLDVGKPITQSRAVDVPLAIGSLRYYAETIDKTYGEVGPSPVERLSYAIDEPLGVVGAITPWNFPLHLAMWKVAPALAAGNSVVLKPAEQSPLTALRLGELALEAGIPDGVLNVTPGLGEVAGRALALHGDVDMIAFTGSGAVGRKLMAYSGQSNLKRVSLELGGKSPQIVFADCPDLEAAAQAAVWGVFYNQGQVCTAASRLLVHRSIKDAFVARVVEIARELRPGDPLDPATRLGALVSQAQMDGVLAHISDASSEGARLLAGGRRVREETGGYFIEPTIFDGVDPAGRLAQREVFGPVLAVMTFEDEDEAVRLANGTVFGLAAGVWTANLDLALRMTRRLHAGLIWVNGWDACDITMPFGGFKQSGFGRDRSPHALRKYADVKSVSITVRS